MNFIIIIMYTYPTHHKMHGSPALL